MSHCKCGGWLGSGGVDSYAGRYCRCANPEVVETRTYTSTQIMLDHFDIIITDKIGYFYNKEYKIFKNSQDLYQVKVKENNRWRWVLDSDLMMAISGNHVPKPEMFFNKNQVDKFIIKHFKTAPPEKKEKVTEPTIEQDWEEIDT